MPAFRTRQRRVLARALPKTVHGPRRVDSHRVTSGAETPGPPRPPPTVGLHDAAHPVPNLCSRNAHDCARRQRDDDVPALLAGRAGRAVP